MDGIGKNCGELEGIERFQCFIVFAFGVSFSVALKIKK